MSTELNLAVVMLVVAVIQVLLPAFFRNGETELDYNAGPRDEAGPPSALSLHGCNGRSAIFMKPCPCFSLL